MEFLGALVFAVVMIAVILVLYKIATTPQKRRGPMSTKRYRVHGRDMYSISYEQQSNGTWKIWCSEHPHNPYSTDVNKCHLYSTGEVCVSSGKEPRTLDRAVAVAQVWMEGYSQYVRSGSFPKGNKRVNV